MTPVERSRNLGLPPMLYNLVLEDTTKCYVTDWDHLRILDRPPTKMTPLPNTDIVAVPKPMKKRKTPSATSRVSGFGIFATGLGSGLSGKALTNYAAPLWTSLTAEKREEYKNKAKLLTEKKREGMRHQE